MMLTFPRKSGRDSQSNFYADGIQLQAGLIVENPSRWSTSHSVCRAAGNEDSTQSHPPGSILLSKFSHISSPKRTIITRGKVHSGDGCPPRLSCGVRAACPWPIVQLNNNKQTTSGEISTAMPGGGRVPARGLGPSAGLRAFNCKGARPLEAGAGAWGVLSCPGTDPDQASPKGAEGSQTAAS